MSKRGSRSKSGHKAKGGQPAGKRFFRFVASPVVRRLILVVVIVALLYVFWDRILSLFGYGLIIVAIALGSLVWMACRRKFSLVKHRWNWVVGGISLALAIWGILAFFHGEGVLKEATLGGSIGQRIIMHSPDRVGKSLVTGLVLLGIIFIVPRQVWSAAKSLPGLLMRTFRQLPPVVSPQDRRAETEPAARGDTAAGRRAENEVEPAQVGTTQSASGRTWQSERQSILTPGGWQLPPIDILDKPTEVKLNREDIDERARLIEDALASYGVEAKVVQVNIGPTVTQFGVEPGWDRKYKEVREKGKNGSYETRLEEVSKTRVRVERITSLANDLALALAAPSIRIEAPVPGAPVVGIEVPNTVFGSVALRGAIESAAFQKVRARSKLAIALGKGAGGEAVAADLARMPHLLIAGATGSGKTVCLNSTICCLLLHNSPDDVRFIMIDPKRVELVTYNGVPHLLAPVVVETDKAVNALRWLNQEMDARYRKLAQAGARNIEAYNKDRSLGEGLPYLVLIIDELADLMMTACDEVEQRLCRLAQLARATGIHLVVATQRPSVDVITGLIKANFPTRISFAVTSQVDSRTILDMVGAEKLLGRGDMLYMPTEASKPKRLQGSFVSDAEIERLVYFWGNQRQITVSSVDFDEVAEHPSGVLRAVGAPSDPLFEEAKHLAQEHKHISASFLQRRLRIGYPRAARLMEELHEAGLVEEGERGTEKF
ncbi:MAG: DNA translocase FtsK [Dehalococcoidia bacterium]